jgi:riboflavin kinase/FMN adenylyltransferase
VLLLRDDLRRAVKSGPNALAVGVFDGVHRGHLMLLERLRADAAARGLGTGVVTFHPHPVSVLRPGTSISYLTSLERRVELLKSAGVDFVAVVQFTSELAQVSADDFARVLVEEAQMRLLMAGGDFVLGRNREGTMARLAEIGAELDFEVLPVELLPHNGSAASSTRVRTALAEGDMEAVAELLGRTFRIRGPVLHGDERGRTIGFPTLNVGVSPDLALPPDGVYVSRCEVDGRTFDACTNVGVRPTFDGTRRMVETHLLDFEGDLYGRVVNVELLSRLRAEMKFDGPDALIAQIRQDVQSARNYLATHPAAEEPRG